MLPMTVDAACSDLLGQSVRMEPAADTLPHSFFKFP